jgi:hypothetical protein
MAEDNDLIYKHNMAEDNDLIYKHNMAEDNDLIYKHNMAEDNANFGINLGQAQTNGVVKI